MSKFICALSHIQQPFVPVPGLKIANNTCNCGAEVSEMSHHSARAEFEKKRLFSKIMQIPV